MMEFEPFILFSTSNFTTLGGVKSAISISLDAIKLTMIFIEFVGVTKPAYHASFTLDPIFGDTFLFPENCDRCRSAIY